MATTAVERFSQTCEQQWGFVPSVRRFPEGTRTARDAAAAIGCELGQIVKSLIFAAPDGLVLVLTSGANQVDVATAAELAGVASLGKADADQVRVATGYAIGGVPPFGHVQQLPTVIDRDLLAFDEIWAAAGTPDSVFVLAPDRLVEFTAGTIGDVAG